MVCGRQAGGTKLFNVFHPTDPFAYRFEPLLHPAFAEFPGRLLPPASLPASSSCWHQTRLRRKARVRVRAKQGAREAAHARGSVWRMACAKRQRSAEQRGEGGDQGVKRD